MPFRGGFLSVSVYLLCLPFLFLSVPSRATESYSSVGQSATLIMWRSAVQVCLGLLRGGLAQLARAPALQAGGQRFESVILHMFILLFYDWTISQFDNCRIVNREIVK